MKRVTALLAVALAAAWPALASAIEFPQSSGGPPVGTTSGGFVEVGPGVAAPEHAGTFVPLLPPACPACPAPLQAPTPTTAPAAPGSSQPTQH